MSDTLLDTLPRHSLNPEPWPRIADKSSFELHESNVRSYCRNFPAVFALAQGSRLRDVNGKSYIDFLSGAGALNYGHNNESIRRPLLRYIEENGITHGLDLHTVAKAEFIDSFQEHILRPRNLRYKMQFTGPTGTNGHQRGRSGVEARPQGHWAQQCHRLQQRLSRHVARSAGRNVEPGEAAWCRHRAGRRDVHAFRELPRRRC